MKIETRQFLHQCHTNLIIIIITLAHSEKQIQLNNTQFLVHLKLLADSQKNYFFNKSRHENDDEFRTKIQEHQK